MENIFITFVQKSGNMKEVGMAFPVQLGAVRGLYAIMAVGPPLVQKYAHVYMHLPKFQQY